MGDYFFQCDVCGTRVRVGDDMLAKRPKGWKRIYNGPNDKLMCSKCVPPLGYKISLNQ